MTRARAQTIALIETGSPRVRPPPRRPLPACPARPDYTHPSHINRTARFAKVPPSCKRIRRIRPVSSVEHKHTVVCNSVDSGALSTRAPRPGPARAGSSIGIKRIFPPIEGRVGARSAGSARPIYSSLGDHPSVMAVPNRYTRAPYDRSHGDISKTRPSADKPRRPSSRRRGCSPRSGGRPRAQLHAPLHLKFKYKICPPR
ncbi:hypothetical protein EVAR_32156_1 [Eumeta japonica]|uniref:Uncharacterized protein n=1 Tax=Eumeta variegata TaxID=151549 RepID=A0A4C1VYA5_EUMVA|nr:hypothetical protein EVAR_32156_1 [Eumeta japonica]